MAECRRATQPKANVLHGKLKGLGITNFKMVERGECCTV